jgi:hypothetical protein
MVIFEDPYHPQVACYWAIFEMVLTGRDATEAVGGKVLLTFWKLPSGLAGSGGVVRFFLLLNEIDFEERLVDMDDWEGLRRELVESGQNPAGMLPIITIGSITFTDHVSVLRYLARKIGGYGEHPFQDYIQDSVVVVVVVVELYYLRYVPANLILELSSYKPRDSS